MRWVAGIRSGVIYTVARRPVDPRWSNTHIQTMLALCATGMHLGLSEDRAFQAAEAIVMQSVCPGISWTYDGLLADIDQITYHEETSSDQEAQ